VGQAVWEVGVDGELRLLIAAGGATIGRGMQRLGLGRLGAGGC
jgi:hypothetical protein